MLYGYKPASFNLLLFLLPLFENDLMVARIPIVQLLTICCVPCLPDKIVKREIRSDVNLISHANQEAEILKTKPLLLRFMTFLRYSLIGIFISSPFI